jgi:hypothetical protein
MKAGAYLAYLVSDNMQKGRKVLQYSKKLQWAIQLGEIICFQNAHHRPSINHESRGLFSG